MLSVIYAECHLFWETFMQSIKNKLFMLYDVIMLSVLAPKTGISLIAPLEVYYHWVKRRYLWDKAIDI